MNTLSRLLQFAGIVVVGIGLIYGVANNDMANEMIFAAIGLVLFAIGRTLRPS
jgi:hypothetical protein